MRVVTGLLVVLLPAFALAADVETVQPDDGARVARQLEATFSRLAERMAPSLAGITAYVRTDVAAEPSAADPRGAWRIGDAGQDPYPGFERRGTITGFFLDGDGHLLTCLHALLSEDGALVDAIDVETHDGRHTLARVVGVEPTINLAVLALAVYPEERPPAFEAAPLGDSDAVRPGQWALALGDPYGAATTYNVGIVSGSPRRQCYQGDLTSTYMQTSLSLHPESFGGPLFDIEGRVVGMMVPPGAGSPYTDPPLVGLSFAMPINVVAGIARALVEKQSFASPWLGFSVLEMASLRARLRKEDPEALRTLDAPLTGIYIDDVYDPSPAASAGVRVGDFLVELDGHRLLSVLDFQKWLYLSGVGRQVRLRLYRDGESREIAATVEARPASASVR